MDSKALPITGAHDLPIPNRFFQHPCREAHLAILFPGLGYHTGYPLFYYTLNLLLERSIDVLCVDTHYNKVPSFSNLSREQQNTYLRADALAVTQAALAQAPYQTLTLIGKSIGTLAIGEVLASSLAWPDHLNCVWLTPLIKNVGLRANMATRPHHAFFVIGDCDMQYDPDLLSTVEAVTGGRSLVIPKADHSLEIPGDVFASLDALEKTMQAIRNFLSG